MTASIVYKGDLRCECTHIQSNSIIETDAPTDNRGKGERFSPTDLVCVSLATCMITTMGIRANDMNVNLRDTKIDITKYMLSEPRRIGKIDITLHIPNADIDNKDKKILEMVGNNCPVMKSLHPDLQLNISYHWS